MGRFFSSQRRAGVAGWFRCGRFCAVSTAKPGDVLFHERAREITVLGSLKIKIAQRHLLL